MPTESKSEHSTSGKSDDSSQQDRQLSPITAPSFSRIVWVTLLCSLFLMSLALPVTAQWVAPDFEVIPEAPWEPGSYPENQNLMPVPANQDLETILQITPLDMKILSQDLSTSLKAAGKIYSRIGLKEPITLRPLINNNTRRVFLYEFSPPQEKIKGAYFPADCNNNDHPYDQSWLALNTITSGNYQYKSAAHELFHAIQDHYPWRKDNSDKLLICDVEEWVYEGMADAAGFFLMEKKMRQEGLSFPEATDSKFYGIRPYDLPLHLPLTSIPEIVKARFDWQGDSNDSVLTAFGYRTSSFWRFLMDRYRTISSINELKEERLLALSEGFMERKGPDSETTWLSWVEKGLKSSTFFGYSSEEPIKYFHYAYGEFLTEFAAWPGSKYKKLNFNDVEHNSFGGCEKKSISYEGQDNTALLALSPRNGESSAALYPLAGRCIQVTVNGAKDKKLTIEIELLATSPTEADQLMLGFARQEHEEGGAGPNGPYTNTVLDDDCYSLARKSSKKPFPCVLLGTIEKPSDTEDNYVRTWRFGPTEVKHDNVTMTYILSNVAPNASETSAIEFVNGQIGFAKGTGHTDTGKLGSAPIALTPDMIPDFSIPNRQQLYGIKKNSGFLTMLNPVNIGTFEVDALDDAGNKIATYGISAAEPVAFGQTGPFQAVVERTVAGNSGPAVTNLVCQLDSEPNGNIIRSDDEVLTFTIDTPLCLLPDNIMVGCQNGCPVVDHFQGTLSLPFGYRYFTENPMEDVVTPGVLLDIDRYHYAVYGTPLQGLGGGGGSGSSGDPSGGPGGENSGDDNGGLGSETNGGVGEIPPCDCSCETYTKLNEAHDNLTASKDTMPDINALLQVAQCRMKCAKPFSECRVAERQAQKNR